MVEAWKATTTFTKPICNCLNTALRVNKTVAAVINVSLVYKYLQLLEGSVQKLSKRGVWARQGDALELLPRSQAQVHSLRHVDKEGAWL